jgi:hypothetical protein
MNRPYPTSLTFIPTPLEVAKSSIVALVIFNVFCYHETALLQLIFIAIASLLFSRLWLILIPMGTFCLRAFMKKMWHPKPPHL